MRSNLFVRATKNTLIRIPLSLSFSLHANWTNCLVAACRRRVHVDQVPTARVSIGTRYTIPTQWHTMNECKQK